VCKCVRPPGDNPIAVNKCIISFGPKRDEVTGEWRKLHNDKLSDLYSLPNIARVVKSRRMRWAGHVACMGEGRVCMGFWLGNLRERTIGETHT